MQNIAPPLVLISMVGLTACSGPGFGDDFRAVLPDERVLINMPTADDRAKDAADGEWSEFYLFTAQVTEDVNSVIGFTLYMVDAITQTPPTFVDEDRNHAVWGPYADPLDPVETVLHVQYHVETDAWTWGFEQKPKGADDSEYLTVIAGELDPGATREVHKGRFAIDFTSMQRLDPNVELTGVFYSDYSVEEAGVQALAALEVIDDGDDSTWDGAYAYEQTHGGDGAMDLIWLGDATGNGQDETHVVRSRWNQSGAGRSDAYLGGGQLGELSGTVSECWDERFNAVYRIEEFLGLQNEEGDPSLCVWAQPEWSDEATSE